MKAWGMLMGFVAMPALAWGGCGPGRTVRDWGLHREWVVEQDCAHPQRPATLAEVPWSQGPVAAPAAAPGRPQAAPAAPEVRCGMRVILWRNEKGAEVHLEGTAMGTARRGEKVAVRAGLGGATLEGIVRGPGEVELLPRGAVR